MAADIAPVLKAPPLAPVANWGGWYVGGHVGYGTAAASTSVSRDVLLEGMTAEGAKGAVYGVHGGYNHQVGRAVVGVEADWSGANLTSSNSAFAPLGAGFTFTAGEKVKSLASIRGRAGLAFDQLMLYGTAGVAWAQADFNATNTFQAAGFQTVNASRSMAGFVVGGGAEWALNNNISLRAEYLRYVFGSQQGPTPFNPAALTLADTTSNKLDSVDVVRVGASYHFSRQATTTAAVAPANWAGWYVGGHVGYGIAAASTSLSNDVTLEGLTAEGAKGAVYGVHGGYNHQVGRAVIGVEADWSGANLTSSNSAPPAFVGGFTFTAGEKVKSLASIRGRAGLASDQLLLYGTAGVAWAQADFDATDTSQAIGFRTVNTSRSMAGFVFGGGAEWALNNNISLRAEYLRYVFGSQQGPTPFNPAATVLADVTSNNLDSVDVVRVGASYHFSRQAAATAAVAPANWGGWYVGGHVGYGIAAASTSVSNDVTLERMTAEGAKGAVYGVHGGYNHQIGRAVVGVEADWSGANLTSSNSAPPAFVSGFTFTAGEKVKSLASIRGRAGLASDQLLLYGTAGVAWAQADFDATDTSQAIGFRTVNTSRSMAGFVFGGGAEWALNNNISLRAEYLRYVFGSQQGPTPFNPAATVLADVTSNKLDSVDVVRVGASYKFSGGVPVVSARY